MSQRPETRRNRHNLPTPAERRLGVARRMPQLASSRALVFIVGGTCLLFGLSALILDNMHMDSVRQANGVGEDSAVGIPRQMQDALSSSQSSQKFFFASMVIGGGILWLATRLYHHPLASAIWSLLLLLTNFGFFAIYHPTESASYYVIVGFAMIACAIYSIQAGHAFRASYERMGRKPAVK